MHFEKSFFKNEVRNGFFVCALMKRAWAAQIEVLMKFDSICRENELKYYADFGTLLGAVRHKGFIPWDDDIDVCMFREDVEKLRKIMDENIYEGYRYSTIYNREDFPMQLDRFTTDSVIFGKENMKARHGFPFIAGIDVFPIDYLPDDNEKRNKFYEEINIIKTFTQRLLGNNNIPIPEKIKEMAAAHGCKLDDRKKILNQTRILFDRYSASYIEEKGTEVAEITEWMNNPKKLFKKDFFEEIVYLPFENIKIPAPSNYDGFLKSEFGEYMTPIMAKDELHEYPFYLKQEKYIYEKTNIKLMEINYEQLAKESNEEREDITYILNEHIEILKKMLNCIISFYTAGNTEEVKNMLASIQDIIIKLGNKLEYHYNEDVLTDTISLLENYCELLFETQNNVLTDSFPDYMKRLIESFSEIIIRVEEISQKDRPFAVAFIFESPEDWAKYEKIYNELNDDSRFKCFLIPIPYYYRNDELELVEDEPEYIGDIIAEKYPIIDYKEFDFGSIVFDCVIKSNPYDGFSFGDAIHPFFHTTEIKKSMTRKVVHIPTFDIMDFNADDARIMYMTKFFIKTPAVLMSDFILLKSEILKDRYREILKGVCDNKWNERVLSYSNVKEIKEELFDICNR